MDTLEAKQMTKGLSKLLKETISLDGIKKESRVKGKGVLLPPRQDP